MQRARFRRRGEHRSDQADADDGGPDVDRCCDDHRRDDVVR